MSAASGSTYPAVTMAYQVLQALRYQWRTSQLRRLPPEALFGAEEGQDSGTVDRREMSVPG